MLDSPDFFRNLAKNYHKHARGQKYFTEIEEILLNEISKVHYPGSEIINLGEIGLIKFPYFKMGHLDSSKLFGLDELILFAFYFVNRFRYRNILDLGANIGLHTLILKKLNFEVTSFEPDINHIAQFHHNMKINNLDIENFFPIAVSDKSGVMSFVQVLDNTTGSHLSGSKKNVYGRTEISEVRVEDFREILNSKKFDFVKMDVEGHEARLIRTLDKKQFEQIDIMLEIGSIENAKEIFKILSENGVSSYSQKLNWKVVKSVADLPHHHTHGSCFISMQGPPNWN